MRRTGWILCAALVGCSSSAGTSSSTAPKPGPVSKPATALPAPGGVALDTSNLVQLSLVADVNRIQAGKNFTIAARFRIKPGWHIYWLNPGESGLRTEVEFGVPKGFALAGPSFPGPHSFKTGTIQNYGYADELFVFARVFAMQLPSKSSRITVNARWLACRESCVRGKALAMLELPTATEAAPSGPVNRVAFAKHGALLPRALSALSGAKTSWGATDAELIIEVPGATLEYFPGESNQLTFTSQVASAGRLVVHFKKTEKRARGVLRVEQAGAERYYKIDLGRNQ